jgi:hypothetical protein
MDNGLSSIQSFADRVITGHKPPDLHEKSVQASGLLGHFSKADVRHWQPRVFRQRYTREGKTLLTTDRAMKTGARWKPTQIRIGSK